jgi:multiple sugar transport system permease protein
MAVSTRRGAGEPEHPPVRAPLKYTKARSNRLSPRTAARLEPYALLLPALIVLLLLVIFPTLFLFYLSLSRWDIMTAVPRFIGLGNFREMFFDDLMFRESVRISAVFTIGAVVVEYALGLALAVALNRKLPGLGIIRTLLIVPMAMTPVVTGLVWRMLYDPTFGMINYLLSLIGLTGQAWVAQSSTALYALMVVDIWQWTPFVFLVLTAGLQSLPNEPFEAARVDGASRWQTFWQITFPLLWPVSLLVILLRTIDAWKVFDIVYAVTKGGPGTATQTLNFYSYTKGFQWFDLGYAAALIVVVLLVATIFTNVLVRFQPQMLEEK